MGVESADMSLLCDFRSLQLTCPPAVFLLLYQCFLWTEGDCQCPQSRVSGRTSINHQFVLIPISLFTRFVSGAPMSARYRIVLSRLSSGYTLQSIICTLRHKTLLTFVATE